MQEMFFLLYFYQSLLNLSSIILFHSLIFLQLIIFAKLSTTLWLFYYSIILIKISSIPVINFSRHVILLCQPFANCLYKEPHIDLVSNLFSDWNFYIDEVIPFSFVFSTPSHLKSFLICLILHIIHFFQHLIPRIY